jgi:hypothetical protein
MIHVEFVPPAFEVEVIDLNDVEITEVHPDGDETALLASLQQRVADEKIKSFSKIRKFDLVRWQERADEAQEQAIEVLESGDAKRIEEFKFRSAVWGDIKSFLRILFHNKCAYCEADFTTVAWGDVEHYRPKKKVTDAKGKVLVDASGTPHGGYYWMAYDLSNLMPSCQLCNQAEGKLNQFPLENEKARVWKRGKLDAEAPLLLNPYRDDPRPKLQFLEGGRVEGLNAAGKASVGGYRLNREGLIDARRHQQETVWTQFGLAVVNRDPAKIGTILKNCVLGRVAFSSAALSHLNSTAKSLNMSLPKVN